MFPFIKSLSLPDFRIAGLLFILSLTLSNRPPPANAAGDFTVVVLPDTQYYASHFPDLFNAQMQWIVQNQAAHNIVFVAGLGDNVDTPGDLKQWARADAAYGILDDAGIPYGVAAGNHDGAPSATENFNAYFGESRFAGQPTYGGHYGDDNDNSYALFEAAGLEFILVFIEFDDGMTGPGHPVLLWADGLLQSYADRRAMLISHNMLEGGTSNAFSRQGQAIYAALGGNPNLFLMMGGHLDVAARRRDMDRGHTVYTLRSDYQFVDSWRSGYLRLLRFSPSRNRIYVRTYSPVTGKYYPDRTDNNFSLFYSMSKAGSGGIAARAPIKFLTFPR